MGFCSVCDGAEATREEQTAKGRVICVTRVSRADKLDICSTPSRHLILRRYCSNASIETLTRRGTPAVPASVRPSSAHRITSHVPRTASVRNRDGLP